MNRTVLILLTFALVGCVKLPTVVMVDRRTALEQQLGMDLGSEQSKLARKALSSMPAPFTQKELARKGVVGSKAILERLLTPYQGYSTDQERVDLLLRQHCIGEAEGGFLVLTPELCTQRIDKIGVTRLIQRVNKKRRQVIEELARLWKVPWGEAARRFHEGILQILVCGGLYKEEGKWRTKECR